MGMCMGMPMGMDMGKGNMHMSCPVEAVPIYQYLHIVVIASITINSTITLIVSIISTITLIVSIISAITLIVIQLINH